MKVAVVHDWLPVFSGAERVLSEIMRVVGASDLYTLYDFLDEHDRVERDLVRRVHAELDALAPPHALGGELELERALRTRRQGSEPALLGDVRLEADLAGQRGPATAATATRQRGAGQDQGAKRHHAHLTSIARAIPELS